MTRFYARVPMMPNDWVGQPHLAVRWCPAEVAGDSQECLSYETNFAPLLNRCKCSQLAGFKSGGHRISLSRSPAWASTRVL
jgi:hypothetical protein